MRWRAWYADGQEFDSSNSDWHTLPRSGCVIVKWWPEEGPKRLECGDDAIMRVGSEFVSVNLPTKEFKRVADACAKAGELKFGELIGSDAYAALYAKALEAQAPEA